MLTQLYALYKSCVCLYLTSHSSAIRNSGVVHVAASEENPIEVECGGSGDGFSVAFDPLDGSSIVDANFAVGTIVGIWPGRGLLGRRGEEQSAAFVCQYGPRVTMAIAFNNHTTVSGERIRLYLTYIFIVHKKLSCLNLLC